MINSLEQAKEQNQKLVAEAFRCTQLNKHAQQEIEALNIQLSAAKHEAQQANVNILTLHSTIRSKDEELAFINSKVGSVTESEKDQKIADLAAHLHEKEVHLAITFNELVAKDQLLQKAQNQLQKLSKERNMLATTYASAATENAVMERDLRNAKAENAHLAGIIIKLEANVKSLEERQSKMQELEAQRADRAGEANNQAFMMPNMYGASPNPNLIENMIRMQMDIQRMHQQNMNNN